MIEFFSSEGTKYIWNEELEQIINLTPLEIQLTQTKVKLMSDEVILNQVSGNYVKMGIPIKLSSIRMAEILKKYKTVLKQNPEIFIEVHAIDRLISDWELDDDHPLKRNWEDEDEIRNCVKTTSKILEIRLNVNHQHIENTNVVKHLHPHFAITILGRKSKDKGKVVTAVLNEKSITVITIL